MTAIERSIKLAIEGGYATIRKSMDGSSSFVKQAMDWHYVVLDPLFWQCLGKAMGQREYQFSWLAKWHLFIDHLAEGKDPESFFAELLKE